jgi:hypothetical protein
MSLILALTLALAGHSDGRAPTKDDLRKAREIHGFQLSGIKPMVGGERRFISFHCVRFKNFKSKRTSSPDTYKVFYEEYEDVGPWKRMQATLRREGKEWSWVEGDKPSCSGTEIIEE